MSVRAVSEPLEIFAEQAGRALACTFSSSDEFEAALIAERRAAGVYGPRKHRKRKLVAAAAVLCGLSALILLVI